MSVHPSLQNTDFIHGPRAPSSFAIAGIGSSGKEGPGPCSHVIRKDTLLTCSQIQVFQRLSKMSEG